MSSGHLSVEPGWWFFATKDTCGMSSGHLSGDRDFLASLTAKVASLRLAVTSERSSIMTFACPEDQCVGMSK